MNKTTTTPANDNAGGNLSLEGWHYQCDVSVMAALDLLVVSRVAKVLQLEPANFEDLEAELKAPRVASSTVVDDERMVVQAKLRRTGPWTPTTLKKLDEHGKKRPSALKLLDNPKVRYVLFTSADVSGKLGDLQVDALLERPEDKALPDGVPGQSRHGGGGSLCCAGAAQRGPRPREDRRLGVASPVAKRRRCNPRNTDLGGREQRCSPSRSG